MYQAAENRYDSMTYRPVGRSGLVLPALSLGLWHNFGDDVAFCNQRDIVRRAFDLGITHFDLANNAGPPRGSPETTPATPPRADPSPHTAALSRGDCGPTAVTTSPSAPPAPSSAGPSPSASRTPPWPPAPARRPALPRRTSAGCCART